MPDELKSLVAAVDALPAADRVNLGDAVALALRIIALARELAGAEVGETVDLPEIRGVKLGPQRWDFGPTPATRRA